MQDSEMLIVNGQQGSNGDENLFVKFYLQPVQNNFETEKQGRPIFVDKLFISIMTPASNLSKMDRPANENDKQRFPKQWMSYCNNQNVETTGTPISEWPALNRTQVEELKAMKFYSVELLANATDAQLNSVGPLGHSLRAKALAYLKSAKDSAEAQRLAAQNERLTNDNLELKAQIADLGARLDAIQDGVITAPKRSPGRPRKVVEPVA